MTSRRFGEATKRVLLWLDWIRKMGWEFSLACLGAVFAWGPRVPLARGVLVLGI